MPKSLITAGRYTYCHDDKKEPTYLIGVHDIFIEASRMKTLFICLSILIMLLTECCLLTTMGLSSFYPIWIFVGILFITSLKLKEIQKETIVIMPTLGIQLETLYWRIRRRFVSIDKILRPVLNECISPVTCYWSLALILHGENELMPVFQQLQLPIRILVPIWKALRAVVEHS